MKNLIYFIIFISNIVTAQNAELLFNDANNLYKTGKYQEAADIYEAIVKTQKVSSELYFNLGNCYYKLNKVADCIYNYEKSLLLNPSNNDATNNLVIAKKLTLDRIEELPKTIFEKINDTVFEKLHYNTWAYLAVTFSIVTCILFLFFYFSNRPSKKRLFFVLSVMGALLLITTVIISHDQHEKNDDKIYGIIFSNEIVVKNEPTDYSSEIFILHEGTKVAIVDTVDEWSKIKLVDGKTGWIPSENLKLINNF